MSNNMRITIKGEGYKGAIELSDNIDTAHMLQALRAIDNYGGRIDCHNGNIIDAFAEYVGERLYLLHTMKIACSVSELAGMFNRVETDMPPAFEINQETRQPLPNWAFRIVEFDSDFDVLPLNEGINEFESLGMYA